MKRKLTIAALLMITVPAFSQFKQSDVVASAGGFEVKDGYSVSYTIGEPVAGTLKAGDLIVVQGFQQGYLAEAVNPPISINDEWANNVTVYPNPVNSTLFVALEKEPAGECLVRCFDMTGRIVGEASFDGDVRVALDVEDLPQGAYFVKVYADDNAVVNRKVMKY